MKKLFNLNLLPLYLFIVSLLSLPLAMQGLSAQLSFVETGMSDISGEIFVNPYHTGKVEVAKVLQGGNIGKGSGIKISQVGGWHKVSVPAGGAGDTGVIISGDKGSLKIAVLKASPAGSDALQLISEPVVRFGEFDATFLMPKAVITEPGSYRIGIYDIKQGKFLPGDVIALKDDEIAVKFYSLSSSVVSSDGLAKISMKKPDGGFLNTSVKIWGYNLDIADTAPGKPSTITADVFGLPKDAKLKFDFQPLGGQKIYQSSDVITVGEIQSGKALGTIVTDIPGDQPINVTVVRVN